MKNTCTTSFAAPVPTIEFNDTGNWNTNGVYYVFDNEVNSGLDGGMFIFVFVFCGSVSVKLVHQNLLQHDHSLFVFFKIFDRLWCSSCR